MSILDAFEHDALTLDRVLWPDVKPGPALCEACGAPADPVAVEETSFSCRPCYVAFYGHEPIGRAYFTKEEN